jgi:Asp-tRNA(Asn)/Glu-tRNA(Gln) amidotransferase A subunit family amidase
MPTPAFPHDHSLQRIRQLDIDGEKVPYLDEGAWAGTATLNGIPATTMPIAHEGNLPIGVQIIGGFLDDNTTIAFAGTDCGLGGRVHADLAWAKLRTLVEGAQLASKRLWP